MPSLSRFRGTGWTAAAGWVLWAAALLPGLTHEKFTLWMGAGLVLLAAAALLHRAHLGTFIRRTGLELPLLLLLASGLLSALIAPDRPLAFARLYLFLLAAALFFLLAGSSPPVLDRFVRLFSAAAALGGLFLASQADWTRYPARFAPVGRAGLLLNQVVPHLGFPEDYWYVARNVSAALLTLALPAYAVWLVQAWSRLRSGEGRARRDLILAGITGLLLVSGLLFSESRTPWLALLLVVLAGAWRWLTLRLVRNRTQQAVLFWGGLLAAAVVAAGLLLSRPAGQVFAWLPGPEHVTGRVHLAGQAWRLAQDVPLTGYGPGAFAGVYSTYIAVHPYRAFFDEDTGVSAYLSLLVEQGWPGLLALLLLCGAALRQAAAIWHSGDGRGSLYLNIGAAGLALLLIHALSHATLLASRAIPFALVPLGLIAAGSKERSVEEAVRKPVNARRTALAGLALVGLAGCGLVTSGSSPAAVWYSNLGAIRAAQVELDGYPRQTWDTGDDVVRLQPAAAVFRKALQYDPRNRTAHEGLGRLALKQLDFDAAVIHFKTAHDVDPGHRGITKNLAYSYLWSGDTAHWPALIADLPEIPTELQAYIHWWKHIGRDDLSELAARGADILSTQYAGDQG